MRAFIGTLLLVCFGSLTQAQDDLGDFHACAHARQHALLPNEAMIDEDGGMQMLDFRTDTDVLHYNLDIEIKPNTRWLGGTNTMTVVSLVDNLQTFRFRLSEGFNISRIAVNDVDATWKQIDHATVEVTLDPVRNTNDQFDVLVAYDGKPVSEGFGSIEFRGSGSTAQIWTLSQTWFAYTWVPLKDELTDKATAELAFTVPDVLVVASNGALQGVDTLENNRKRYRWETNYPTDPYLFCFAAAAYKTYEQTWTYGDVNMPVQLFIYPGDDSPDSRERWFRSVTMLTTFSDKFGLYPFSDEKYGMTEFGWGGGMEHQTNTFQGGFWEYITAHELSHQWWGDNITCATWHDIWLNEGFATYAEAIWYEFKPGSPGKSALFDAMANRRPGRVDSSVYVYDDTDFNRIFDYDFTYLKGGWVTHMLRHVLRDDAFFAMLAEYRSKYDGSTATTADFQAVAEGYFGGDMTWFFEPWIYDIGAPAYSYGWRKIAVDGRNYAELYVKQTQRSDYPIFTMPVDVVTTIGSDKTVNVIWNDAAAEHFLIPTSGAISNLTFDPDNWILATGKSNISFVEGPPKIATLSPAPGEQRPPAGLDSVRIVFHKDVTVDAGQLAITDADGNVVPVTFAYDASRFAVTLTPQQRLALGRYTLTVSDGVKDVKAGKALDGEIADPDNPSALPSGDGLPGGAAVANFYIVPPPGDLNCDGQTDFADIDAFVLALTGEAGYQQQYPDCNWRLGDLNGDGDVNFDDIDPFVALLTK